MKIDSVPSPTGCVARSPTGQREGGTLVPMVTSAGMEKQDQSLALQLKLPSPESDSNKKINLKETTGEKRKNRVRIWLREAKGEAEERGRGCSGQASALQGWPGGAHISPATGFP